MKSEEKRTLTSISKLEEFSITFSKLVKEEKLDENELSYLLSCSIVFSKAFEKDRRFTSYSEIAYYIILKYAILQNDFRPLFDFSTNFGYFPISNSIIEKGLLKESGIFDIISTSQFIKQNQIIETIEQRVNRKFILETKDSDIAFIAPTSYGKSSIISEYIKNILNPNIKICIMVPTKSLLVQTFKMIRAANFGIRIIVHDEMYDGDNSFISVLTQERGLRLIEKNDIAIDYLFIDEAHHLLSRKSRSILLTRFINKSKLKIIYLSPLVDDSKNLATSKDQKIKEARIHFSMKEAEIFEYRLDGSVHKYNRFLNLFYKIKKEESWSEYILKNSTEKTFIYIRRPSKIENFARNISKHFPVLEDNNLDSIAHTLAEYTHKDFYIVDLIRRGILYLHGKIPDIIKEYLESKFSSIEKIKFVIANTVILEGINMPITSLFILNTYSLKGKELTNLIGRVNRLNSIFTENDTNFQKLLPPVHFVNTIEYAAKNSKMHKKIELLRSKVFKDEIKNPLLNEFTEDFSKETEKEIIREIIENEKAIMKNTSDDFEKFRTYCINKQITEHISNSESILKIIYQRIAFIMSNKSSWQELDIITRIYKLFIEEIDEINDFEIGRLENLEARRYYSTHIQNMHQRSLRERIKALYEYFLIRSTQSNPLYYFGKSYGETKNVSDNYPNPKADAYVNLSIKTPAQLINLAIVKLKMEDDFVSFKLNKFVTCMFDYKLISELEYNQFIHGTDDMTKLIFARYGLSGSLISRLEQDNQLQNIQLDNNSNLVGNNSFKEFKNAIDDFYRFEIERFI